MAGPRIFTRAMVPNWARLERPRAIRREWNQQYLSCDYGIRATGSLMTLLQRHHQQGTEVLRVSLLRGKRSLRDLAILYPKQILSKRWICFNKLLVPLALLIFAAGRTIVMALTRATGYSTSSITPPPDIPFIDPPLLSVAIRRHREAMLNTWSFVESHMEALGSCVFKTIMSSS
jgi:hypothetical protein